VLRRFCSIAPSLKVAGVLTGGRAGGGGRQQNIGEIICFNGRPTALARGLTGIEPLHDSRAPAP
jgi:hypothetical protein